MPAQSFWRVTFERSAGAYVNLVEAAFLDAAGADLSVGGTATASSAYASDFSAEKAFDKSQATFWATAQDAVPAWLQYAHATPVSAAKLRLVYMAEPTWMPAGRMEVYAGPDQSEKYLAFLESGAIQPGATATFALVNVPPPTLGAPELPLLIQGLEGADFAGAVLAGDSLLSIRRDFRLTGETDGTWTDRVMFKAASGSPEQPFAAALVWVLRRADGYLAWSGFSDANGYYTATRLERGVSYVAVGIDPRDATRVTTGEPGLFKAVGAGPFTVPAA